MDCRGLPETGDLAELSERIGLLLLLKLKATIWRYTKTSDRISEAIPAGCRGRDAGGWWGSGEQGCNLTGRRRLPRRLLSSESHRLPWTVHGNTTKRVKLGTGHIDLKEAWTISQKLEQCTWLQETPQLTPRRLYTTPPRAYLFQIAGLRPTILISGDLCQQLHDLNISRLLTVRFFVQVVPTLGAAGAWIYEVHLLTLDVNRADLTSDFIEHAIDWDFPILLLQHHLAVRVIKFGVTDKQLQEQLFASLLVVHCRSKTS